MQGTEVKVNGRTAVTPYSAITYEGVVELAGKSPGVCYTVTWSLPGQRGGELRPKQTVVVRSGMSFVVAYTSGA